jgi:dolichol-phosphate mannosyltransferase
MTSQLGTNSAPIELALIVPTFNERDNIVPLLNALKAPLAGIAHEVIFVDDNSPDGTGRLIERISKSNPQVRVLHRKARRGLSSACMEGVRATAAHYIAVMDADLQHDETILPIMFARIKAEHLDVVVGTRNGLGGGMGQFSKARVALSHSGKLLTRLFCNTGLSDPMSGFFVADRHFITQLTPLISGAGFKILLELIAAAPRPVRLGEVPYTFRTRLHGDSKLNTFVGLAYLRFLFNFAGKKLLKGGGCSW